MVDSDTGEIDIVKDENYENSFDWQKLFDRNI